MLQETESRRKDCSLSPARPRSLPAAEQALYRLNDRSFTEKKEEKEKVASTEGGRRRLGQHVIWGRGLAGRQPVDWTGGGAEAWGRGLCPCSLHRGPLIWICGNVCWSGPAAVPASSLSPGLPVT